MREGELGQIPEIHCVEDSIINTIKDIMNSIDLFT